MVYLQQGQLLDKIIQADLNGFYSMCIQTVIVSVCTGLISHINRRSMDKANEETLVHIQQKIFAALLTQDMAFYDGATNLYQRMDWGLSQMLEPFQGLVRFILVSVVSLIGAIIMCWSISWKLTLLSLSTLGPMSYISMLFSHWSRLQMTAQYKLEQECWNILYQSFDNVCLYSINIVVF